MPPWASKARKCAAVDLRAELVDRAAVERGRVDLARGVLAERGEVGDRERLLARAGAELAAARAQAPDRPAAEVAVDVAAAERRDRLAPVDVAARDRAAVRVAVDGDREDERPPLGRR